MTDGALAIIDELRSDSKIGKNKHFHASERKLRYHFYCGVPVILINVFIGTVIVAVLSSVESNEIVSVAAAVLAFSAASLSALQTLFNFHKIAEGHRTIGNRYLSISRRCKHLIQKQFDEPSESSELWEIVSKLEKEYEDINKEAEAFPTGKADLKNAKNAIEITKFTNPHEGESDS